MTGMTNLVKELVTLEEQVVLAEQVELRVLMELVALLAQAEQGRFSRLS
jgi:hypothetical protein